MAMEQGQLVTSYFFALNMKICNTTIKRKNNEDRDMSIITQKNSRQKKFVSGLAQYLDFSPEVRKAKKNKAPLVALESTIIAHGMPYPQNLATAQAVEKIVRQNGATPATIAILEGKIKIGLTSDELKQLASSPDVAKVSRRDMATIITCKKNGATTVSATMIAAHLAGIELFVTGGIGGVHRGAENSMDISADLSELAQTSVAVVCAGAKSILDLPKTLEYLETHGVPIIGFKTDEFPAFYSRASGLSVDHHATSVEEVANIIRCKWKLNLAGGIVIANPIPRQNELLASFINPYIENAIKEAARKNISGKELTPFLLKEIKEATKGKGLDANIALVKHNAMVGAKIAAALSKI